jgi:hypothetical protein
MVSLSTTAHVRIIGTSRQNEVNGGATVDTPNFDHRPSVSARGVTDWFNVFVFITLFTWTKCFPETSRSPFSESIDAGALVRGGAIRAK